jgi:hypothetical protein
MRVETVAKRALLMSWEKRMDEARIARWCGLSFDALFVVILGLTAISS